MDIEIITCLFQTWLDFSWKEVTENIKKSQQGEIFHILFLYWKAQDNTTLLYTQKKKQNEKLKKHEEYSTVT